MWICSQLRSVSDMDKEERNFYQITARCFWTTYESQRHAYKSISISCEARELSAIRGASQMGHEETVFTMIAKKLMNQ